MGARRCSRHVHPQPAWGPGGAAPTLILNLNGGQEVQPAMLVLNLNGRQEVQLLAYPQLK